MDFRFEWMKNASEFQILKKYANWVNKALDRAKIPHWIGYSAGLRGRTVSVPYEDTETVIRILADKGIGYGRCSAAA